VDVLCRLATQAHEVQADVVSRAAELLQQAELPRGGAVLVFRASVLAPQPAYLVAEVFRLVWRREGWPMDAMGFTDWQRLTEIVAGQRPAWEFPSHVRARRLAQVLQLHRQEP
jgi:hypothetical protein